MRLYVNFQSTLFCLGCEYRVYVVGIYATGQFVPIRRYAVVDGFQASVLVPGLTMGTGHAYEAVRRFVEERDLARFGHFVTGT
jgi:hypothetical protein